MDYFYEEYEDSYIDGNTHGVITQLIADLSESGLLDGEWDPESDWRKNIDELENETEN